MHILYVLLASVAVGTSAYYFGLAKVKSCIVLMRGMKQLSGGLQKRNLLMLGSRSKKGSFQA